MTAPATSGALRWLVICLTTSVPRSSLEAERVTMMHDGRVIVEGTPAEIRANETVHDLYLGRGYRNE